MNKERSRVAAILANCILQKRRETKEILGVSWDEVCIMSAVGLAIDGGNPANISRIADMCTMSHTTASRHVHNLTKQGWITKINTKPYPVYTRTTHFAKQKKIEEFLRGFEQTIFATGNKIKHCGCGCGCDDEYNT